MNTNGTSDNLIAPHPKNKNSLKAGVYSMRSRDERAADLRIQFASAPLAEALTEIRQRELFDLLALRDALSDDIAINGTCNRRRELRRQVPARLRTSRRIEELLQQIDRPDKSGNREVEMDATQPAVTPDPYEKHRERYEALQRLALETTGISPAAQIRAIQLLLAQPKPPPRGLVDYAALTDEEVDAILASATERVGGPRSAEPERDTGEETLEQVRGRCIQALHEVATGARSVTPNAQLAAQKALAAIDTVEVDPVNGFIARELAGLASEDLDEFLKELLLTPDGDDPEGAEGRIRP